tara:strand:- start:678 stop:1427 length:750 start_codon:yes stop_codon:yes gene_type:complete
MMMLNNTINKNPLVWIGIFAHPDDETTSSSGTMMKWVKNNNEAYIITGTRGEEGTLGTGDLKIKREDLGKVREKELRHNLDLYGAKPPYIFDYRDQDLDKETPEVLAKKILTILKKISPDIIVTFGPTGISNHPDHIAIHKSAVIAYKYYKSDTNQNPLLIYPAISEERAKDYGLELSEDEKRLDIVVDIEDTFETKIQGLKNYKSQEDAQQLAKRFVEHNFTYESFSISPVNELDKNSTKLINYLASL